MRKDIVTMSVSEIKRVGILERLLERDLTQKEAASAMGVSPRQVRRLLGCFQDQGEKGLIHGLRGKASNHKHPEAFRRQVLKRYRDSYMGFGPTLTQEKLRECHKLRLGRETLREWLLEVELWTPRRRRDLTHRQWRERKACYGEMVQMDGSHHDWLEGRGPKLVLIAMIDDATSEVFAKFYAYEGTFPAMDCFYHYVKRHGLPSSLYMDRHRAYAREGQLGRALSTLDVTQIFAHSPQAKGRIERLFRTFQDRLVKESRLKGVKTQEGANHLLKAFLPPFNQRFRKEPRSDRNLHHPLPPGVELKQVLSIQIPHALRPDNTIRHQGKLFQIVTPWRGGRPKRVTVEERMDGRLYFSVQGRMLRWYEIKTQAIQVKKAA